MGEQHPISAISPSSTKALSKSPQPPPPSLSLPSPMSEEEQERRVLVRLFAALVVISKKEETRVEERRIEGPIVDS